MRILGLDIGKYSVKALDIESSFKKFEVHDYYEAQIHEGEGPYAVASQVISKFSKLPDRIAVTLPASQFTIRSLDLPIRDKKAIQSGIVFQLEDELPFDLEEAIYDYTILHSSKAGSQIHVEATLEHYVKDMVDSLFHSGIDPDVITTPSWAYRTLLNQVLGEEAQTGGPLMLIDIGHAQSSIYLHYKGRPISFKQVAFGGAHITEAISQKYGISQDEAEKAKLESGFVMSPSQRDTATEDQLSFSDAIHDGMRKLLVETRQIGLICKTLTHHSPQAIYLTGTSSLIPGLWHPFEEEIKIPTQNLKSLSGLSSAGINYSEASDATYSLAAGAALSLISPDRIKPINLRKGTFAKSGTSSNLRYSSYKKPLMAAAAMLLCFFISMWAQESHYEDEMEKMDKKLKNTVQGFLGHTSSSAMKTYMRNPSRLRAKIKTKINQQRTLAKLFGGTSRTPIQFLKRISERIPKSIVVDMTSFTVGAAPKSPYQDKAKHQVELTFLVGNPQMAEKLNDKMKALLDDYKKSKLEKTKSPYGDGMKWKVTYSGSVKENVYGG